MLCWKYLYLHSGLIVYIYHSCSHIYHPSIYPHTSMYVHQCMYINTFVLYMLVSHSIHSSTHPSNHPFIHLSINPQIHPSIHLFIHSSIHKFLCLSTYTIIYITFYCISSQLLPLNTRKCNSSIFFA